MLLCSAQTIPKKVKMKSNTIEEDVVFDVGSLYAHLQGLKDSRKPRGIRYPLVAILVMMVMAKLCGEDTPSGMADWVKYRAEQFIDLLKLRRKRMPHHSTYRRIEAEVVDPEELEQMVSNVLAGRKFFGKQVLLSMDGKVLRGTLDEVQNGIYLLAAYLPGEGVVLMEVAIEGKGCEIPGAAKLLKLVDLREKVVMGDAMHTQRAVSIQIVEAGGDYIWFAKGNQPQLEEDIRLWFGPEPDPIAGQGRLQKDFEAVKETSKGHGRLEERRLTVSSQLNDFLDWPYVQQVFQLERRVVSTKTGEVQEQVVYGLTSLSREEITPGNLLKKIRAYWGIENGLHYRRDVTLREDRTRMTQGNAGRIMACLNNLVIGLVLTKTSYTYLPHARRFFDAYPLHAFALISRL
jgi:predicted transposase YbfD/YdcC